MANLDVIEVLDGGLYTTVQDLGRYGFQRYGVPVSGAMDTYALRIGNILLGNPDNAAAIEITLVGPKLKFLADTSIVLSGADLTAHLDQKTVPTHEVFTVRRGSLLAFEGPMVGSRAYLAVAGGIHVPLVMGSASTYTRSNLGGLEGRTLLAGDHLLVKEGGRSAPNSFLQAPPEFVPIYDHEYELRVVMGPQQDSFTHQGTTTFLGSTYTVSQHSDRVGYRLMGPTIQHKKGADIISDGVPFGAVQITGDGLPVILMADRGTTGGYTKIAAVIAVDIPKIAQALPGDKITFKAITIQKAHELLIAQEDGLQHLKKLVKEAGQKLPSKPRVTVNGEAFEVCDEEGRLLTQTNVLNGRTRTSRNIVRATVKGTNYTFEVEVVQPQ